MTALASSRNTPEWNGSNRFHLGLIPVEASTSLYVGGMVAINGNGNAVPAQIRGAAPLSRLNVVGICEYVYAGGQMPPGVNALNQTGNGALFPGATATLGTAGAISVGVVVSVFGMDHDTSVTAANVGELVFASDDHTVTMGTLVPATTTITTPVSGAQINVLKPDIVPGTFAATSGSNGTGTKYVEGTDFAVDYQAGLFTALAGGAIANNVALFISYFSGAGLVPAGRLIAIDGGLAYVNFADKSVGM